MQARRRIALWQLAHRFNDNSYNSDAPVLSSPRRDALHNMQETMFVVPSGNLLGLKRRRPGVQQVSWLLWTGVFRGAAPVAQAVLPTLMLPKRSRHWLRALGQRENGSLGIGME